MSSATTYSASPRQSDNVPSALHILLFIVGFILGKLFKFALNFLNGIATSPPQETFKQGKVKPARHISSDERERVPAITRRSGVRLSDWYAQNVVNATQCSTSPPVPENLPPPEVPSADSSDPDETPFGMEIDVSVNEDDERIDAVWNT